MGDNAINYAKAILSNQYINGFQESVLQALDESLIQKSDIYDEPPPIASNLSFFE
jgi:hypothetical protein